MTGSAAIRAHVGVPPNGPAGKPHASRPLAEEAFAAMVLQATHHPDVAQGLAMAYRSFGPEERRRLARLVADDAARQGADPCSALAVLLGVEGDPEVARVIAETMMHHSRSAACRATEVEAWMGGDGDHGAAAIARSSPGGQQVLWVRWGPHGLAAGHEPLPSWSERETVVRALGLQPAVRPTSRELTIDTLAAVLWCRRRRGVAWPPSLTHLADLFAPPPMGLGQRL